MTQTSTQLDPKAAAVDETVGGAMPLSAFDVIREIGRGGMATISLAREKAPPFRQVALKVMQPHLAMDPTLVRRFEHEVRSHLGLVHPCLVEMLAWGRDAQGRPFIAMEYVEGPTLKELLALGRKFPVDLAVHVTLQLLDALRCVHGRGVIHRDVKPANIMVTADGRVKLMDFGIAKAVDATHLTTTGNVIGTPAYMAPEQALGREVDHRADLFSVGVVLEEMLVGANPFQTGNAATTLSRVVHHKPRPVFETLPHVPGALEALVTSLLDKDPSKRPASADAALNTLTGCLMDEELSATAEAMAEFVREPDVATRRLNARRARRHLERGIQVHAKGKGSADGALWEFFLATLLDPSSPEARTWLEQVSSERGYSLNGRRSPRIDELEARLQQEPDNLQLTLQLAKLHKAQGNFLQVILYYKRAKALKPPDRYTQTQIETLVAAPAVAVIDGTSVLAAPPVASRQRRPSAQEIAERQRAEGWTDFVRGILSTWWGRSIVIGCLVGGVVLGAGALFDHAAQAARISTAPVETPGADPMLEAQVALLDQGKRFAHSNEAARAEAVFRKLLDGDPPAAMRSEALFRLGDSLERQGKRPEALDVHQSNAAVHAGEWGIRSRLRRGEIFIAQGERAAARTEYEAAADAGEGDLRLEAMLALAQLSEDEGRLEEARAQFEALVAAAAESPLRDKARLGMADLLVRLGDTKRAATLYAAVRDSTDHRGPAWHRAQDALQVLASGGTTIPAPDPREDVASASEGEPEAEEAAMDEETAATSEPALAPAPVDATPVAAHAASAPVDTTPVEAHAAPTPDGAAAPSPAVPARAHGLSKRQDAPATPEAGKE